MDHEIMSFISRFTGSGKFRDVIQVFTSGACYWFAKILHERFSTCVGDPDVVIVYDSVINHFGCRIHDRVYDITGDCTEKYNWSRWPTFEDIRWERRVVRDCILFKEEDDDV